MEWLYALIGLLGIGLGAAGGYWFTRKQNAAEVDSLNKQIIGRDEQINLLKEQVETSKQISFLKEKVGDLGENLTTGFQNQQQKISESITKQAEATSTRLTNLNQRLETINELSGQTTRLERLLSNSQSRGAFGEVQMENLIKDILPPKDYVFQEQLPNKKIADCLLKLPQGPIAIDAKFPITAWEALNNADSAESRKAATKQLQNVLIKNIGDIADRYIINGYTADYAFMFVPSEAIFIEIQTNLKDVRRASFEKRVGIVSPTTMMGTLLTVRALLRDERMREATQFLKQQIGLLLNDIDQLNNRVGKLDQHFSLAQKDVDEIGKSTRAITRTGEKIENIETSQLPNPASTSTTPLLPSQTDSASEDEET